MENTLSFLFLDLLAFSLLGFFFPKPLYHLHITGGTLPQGNETTMCSGYFAVFRNNWAKGACIEVLWAVSVDKMSMFLLLAAVREA